jgi:hypothetical protein
MLEVSGVVVLVPAFVRAAPNVNMETPSKAVTNKDLTDRARVIMEIS